MEANQKIKPFVVLSLLIFLLAGCYSVEPIEIVTESDFAEQQLGSSVAKRFQQSAFEGPTAVESAIELSKKYARLSEEVTGLRQKNQDLIAENRHLKEKAATRQAELQQAQKELAEANELLREMLIELNNWKTDVIGFRGEMRDAEKAQLQALLKVLKILGGEVKIEPTQSEGDTQVQKTTLEAPEDTDTTEVSSNEPSQSPP